MLLPLSLLSLLAFQHQDMEKGQDRVLSEFGYNVSRAEEVALDRRVPDLRDQACHALQYNTTGVTVSVVIIFHDELLSNLLRTITSVINTSPAHNLLEVFSNTLC